MDYSRPGFLASIVEAFTGYLSQQNSDSQWIATNGKDAFNAAGVGAFFNRLAEAESERPDEQASVAQVSGAGQ